jgi:uncharacterized membrane protein YcaP (DUF421 family)
VKPEEIKLWDWPRMLLGEVPPYFLLEVVLRMALVYAILMVSMRFLGKRMAAQLTRNEMAAMVSLAAAIGVPILSPDRGILPGIIIAVVVVSISRLTAYLSSKNEKFQAITQGRIDTLIKDGVMDIKTMTRTRISRERIMSELRSESIQHLGQIKRLYMEANGNFTIVRNNEPKPGLAVIPDDDPELLRELKSNSIFTCHQCGNTNSGNVEQACSNCSEKTWIRAVETSPDF